MCQLPKYIFIWPMKAMNKCQRHIISVYIYMSSRTILVIYYSSTFCESDMNTSIGIMHNGRINITPQFCESLHYRNYTQRFSRFA